MTAACGGGTSHAKPGLEAFVSYSSGALALLLQAKGAGKLTPLIPLLGIGAIDLGAFCASDPPALPVLTEDEVFSLLALRLDGDFVSGLAKMRDLAQRIIWYEACECTTGSPTAFVNPTLPTNTPDPILPPAPATLPCQSNTGGILNIGGGSYTFRNTLLLGVTPGTSYRATVRSTVSIAPGSATTWTIKAHALAGGTDATLQTIGVTSATQVYLADPKLIPPGTDYVYANVAGGGPGTSDVAIDLDAWCGGDVPGAQQTPCCPPDAATQAYLDLILSMVTLIQRQSVPFSYVYGTNHTGLTDNGLIVCSGLIGVSVDVTTLPSSYGRSAGSPELLFDVGRITLGTADGYELSRRIDQDGTLMLPAAAGAFTSIGYSLSAGVVASIRELVREP